MQDRLNAMRSNLGKRTIEPLPNWEFAPRNVPFPSETMANDIFNDLKRFLTGKFNWNGAE